MKINGKNIFGFTLIEVLAVILILAIIAIIAIPVTAKIIDEAKKNAFKVSAQNISDAAANAYALRAGSSEYYYVNGVEYTTTSKKLSYTGKRPLTGRINVTPEGVIALALYNGKYCATKAGDEDEVTVKKTSIDQCVTYNIIETDDTWEEIANEYDTTTEFLLGINEEEDINSDTSGKKIKVPIRPGSEYVSSENSSNGPFYKTYYSLSMTTYSESFSSSTYTYTIELGVLPLSIDDINAVKVTAKSVYEKAEDFEQYVIKKKMGEVIWPEGEEVILTLEDAPRLQEHAVRNSNMTADDVSVSCDSDKCYATIKETVDNLNGVDPYNDTDVYLPVKFTVEFNGDFVCPTGPVTSESCFTFDNATGTITDYDYTNPICPSQPVIPSSIAGVTVTTIGANAFKSNNLTCVSFPNTLTTIKNYAFQSNKLMSLTVPSNVTSVGDSAFANNNFTSEIKWNANISSVGSYYAGIFAGSSIPSITFDASLTKIPNNILSEAVLGFTNYTIPSNITNIGSYAFYNTNLQNLTISSNVATIGSSAFKSDELLSLTVPSNVTSVGDSAFANNNFTSDIKWNANISSVGSYYAGIFAGSSIPSITFNSSLTKMPSNILSEAVLGFTSYTVPNNITNIGSYAFYNTKLQNITISSNVATIGSSAFQSDELLSLTVPSNVTSVGDCAFANNNFTGDIKWNANISSVGSYYAGIFAGSSIPSITFNSSLTKIPNNLLSEAVLGFTSYTVPSNIIDIGSYAFYNTGLSELNLHNSVAIIGTGAFKNDQISSITFPNSLTNIGSSAFQNNELLSLTVPSNVTSVGDSAFANNNFTSDIKWNANISSVGSYYAGVFAGSYIPSITFDASLTKISSNILSEAVLGFTSYTVPSNIIDIGSYAFYNTKLQNITISSNVATIGSSAFQSDELLSLTVPSNVTSVGDCAFASNNFTSDIKWNANISSVGSYYAGIFAGSSIPSITFDSSLTKLPNNILSEAVLGFTSYTIPNNITNIGSYAFYNTKLQNITISSNVATIGSSAFQSDELLSLTVPSNVTSVGDCAFANNNFTSDIKWNANISSVGSYYAGIFAGSSIPSITFNSSLTKIPNNILSEAVLGFTSYTIPSSITNIGSYAFYKTKLVSVSISNSVTNVGSYAFSNCSSLSNVTIDNSIGSITLGTSSFGAIIPVYLR